MQRRRFLRNTVFALSATLLSACARTFRLPLALMATPESGAGSERDPNGAWVEGAAYARWTPSPHNIQPWLLRIVSPTECDLLVDPSRLLPVTDPTSAFTTMGMAMFVENLAVAVQPRGLAVQAVYVNAPLDYNATRPTLFATLHLVPSASPSAFDRQVILERKTSRLTYDGHPVADSALEPLASLSTTHGHTLRWSSDDAMVSWIIDLNRFTLFSDLNDAPTRTELRRWIRPADSEAAAKKDGLWAHCLRFPGWLLKAFFDDHEKWGKGWRASICGKMLIRGMHGTRTVAWWSGPFSTPADWRAAGVVLGQSWLALARQGIHMHPLGSIITNPAAHAKLVGKLALPAGADPLWLIVRLGRSDTPPRSYRLDERSIFVGDGAP